MKSKGKSTTENDTVYNVCGENIIGGHKETVHVKNNGRCKELLIPGCGEAINDARKVGVEVLFLRCHVEPDELIIVGN